MQTPVCVIHKTTASPRCRNTATSAKKRVTHPRGGGGLIAPNLKCRRGLVSCRKSAQGLRVLFKPSTGARPCLLGHETGRMAPRGGSCRVGGRTQPAGSPRSGGGGLRGRGGEGLRLGGQGSCFAANSPIWVNSSHPLVVTCFGVQTPTGVFTCFFFLFPRRRARGGCVLSGRR